MNTNQDTIQFVKFAHGVYQLLYYQNFNQGNKSWYNIMWLHIVCRTVNNDKGNLNKT